MRNLCCLDLHALRASKLNDGSNDHLKVFNRGARATGYPHTLHARKLCRIGEILGRFDL